MFTRKVLLAEDDEDDQRFFMDFLHDRSDIFLMPVADNGEVLFTILSELDSRDLPDLIVLDQNMPKISGLQALRFLKADSRYKKIPVCIYSTYTDETLIKTGIEAGAFFVISKPVAKEGYHQMMDKLFEALPPVQVVVK